MVFNLSLNIDTDQDCEVLYNGKSYCYNYVEDLEINKNFSSRDSAIQHLKSITVGEGKASNFVEDLFKNAIDHFEGCSEEYFSFSGNQELEISIVATHYELPTIDSIQEVTKFMIGNKIFSSRESAIEYINSLKVEE